MQPMTLKKRRAYLYILIVVFFVIIPLIMLYTSGYRIGKGFKLVETGGIYIYSPESGSEIYIDNKKKKETSALNKDLFVQNLKPDTYSILIAKDGFWPWAKEVTVEEKRVSEAIAFLIPKEPRGETITKTVPLGNNATSTEQKPNPEYKKVMNLFTTDDLIETASTSPIESRRGRVNLWKENDVLFAKWLKNEKSLPNYFCRDDRCEDTVLVFESITGIKNFDFYPGREDVVLMGINEGIFAIEIDARKHQNFQPVYKGADPYFIIDDGQFYIKDGGNLFKINL